ncbi:UNVERIFIED_CONTAM: hypothetical protein GTU68_063040 [Idotea baltica]|nr:hypothetical protein [Idotea baltica]
MSSKSALLILDGWGIGKDPNADAISQASTPFVDRLEKDYPCSNLITYGMQVGLPEGQMGNSEVGHLNIGAGRIVYQQFARINKAVADGELANNPVLIGAADQAIESGQPIHLFGLLSDGGVHSHISHLKALITILEARGAKQIFIHAFTDGRDTDPHGGASYLQDLEKFLVGKKAKIATVIGRYYAMDRDNRWERVKLAYDVMVHNKGTLSSDLVQSIKDSYAAGHTDEFILPLVADNGAGKPVAAIKDHNLLICFNFRTDRPREISEVLTQNDMATEGMFKLNVPYVTMTKYDSSFKNVAVLFENDNLVNTMGEVLAKAGKSQLRIAETEKYPHVTFFFSGGREEPFLGEQRILIPSPKVATYDLQPEMSAFAITDAVIKHVHDHRPDFICLNYANADMVGHTGDFEAAKKAAQSVDTCVSKLVPILLENEYEIIIIADHGNADYMINSDGSPNTAHTKNPVPCILVGAEGKHRTLHDGKLGDLAPTLLHLMGVSIPPEMDGSILTLG